jgi:predicted Zn-dependent protease
MQKIKTYLLLLIVTLTFSFEQSARRVATAGENQFNLFTIEDDKKLGARVAAEIESSPDYKILSEKDYPQAYQYLRGITNKILNSGKVKHRNDFLWQVKIIHDDKTLNAFCTPGGYIYVYTGIIKFLDNEDQLAGVMGHEIAHADRRHSTRQMTRTYGIQTLLDIVLGKEKQGIMTQIAQGLIGLKYGREAEKEADDYSVIYLCATEYQSNGAAGFFQKLLSQGKGAGIPEFLSTHPSPTNRVTNINQKAANMQCSTKLSGKNYQAFKNMLPK